MTITRTIESGMVVAATVTITKETGGVRRLADIEADVIRFALEHYNGNMTGAARHLGISRSSIYRKTEGKL